MLHSTTRRATLVAAGALVTGALAAGTLAAVTLRRKPGGPVIHTASEPDEAVPLQAISVLAPTDPPHAPAEVTFHDAEGAEHRLADFAGKGLVVNLWATWCVPCVAEMPALQAFSKKVADKGVVVLPLSSDRGGAAVVKKFFAAHGIDALPVWLDPKGEAARGWGARGLPTTLIIDRQGREVGRLEGAVDWDSADAVSEILRIVG